MDSLEVGGRELGHASGTFDGAQHTFACAGGDERGLLLDGRSDAIEVVVEGGVGREARCVGVEVLLGARTFRLLFLHHLSSTTDLERDDYVILSHVGWNAVQATI